MRSSCFVARLPAVPSLRRTSVAHLRSLAGAALSLQRAGKGDYGFNVFHNSNPQHGGSYARHERRMRDDEVEDFLKSVKHWTPVHEDVADNDRVHPTAEADADADEAAEPPAASPLQMGEEAIMRTFSFDTYRDAYLFMGRVWAFCYGSDKYPHVTWEGTSITVYLYSPSFRGLSKREARVAAFLNDQYNMARKSKQQQRRIVDGIVHRAAVEELMGQEVAATLAQRHAVRTAPLREMVEGPTKWRSAIAADALAAAVTERKAAEREEERGAEAEEAEESMLGLTSTDHPHQRQRRRRRLHRDAS